MVVGGWACGAVAHGAVRSGESGSRLFFCGIVGVEHRRNALCKYVDSTGFPREEWPSTADSLFTDICFLMGRGPVRGSPWAPRTCHWQGLQVCPRQDFRYILAQLSFLSFAAQHRNFLRNFRESITPRLQFFPARSTRR